jgi:hypothetical protein
VDWVTVAEITLAVVLAGLVLKVTGRMFGGGCGCGGSK